MDAAIRAKWIIEPGTIPHTHAIDENDDVFPQVALLVQNIAAQARVDGKCRVQRIAQHRGRSVDFRQFGESP